MSSDIILQSEKHVEFKRRMSPGFRLVLIVIGLFPLIAPYELLIKPAWTTWLHPFFFLVLVVALGAIAVSGFFIFAGLAGLSQRISFDLPTKTVTHESESVLTRFRQTRYRFADIERLDIIEHEWSEGPATYNIQVQIKRGAKIEFGGFDLRADAERYKHVLEQILDLAQV